MEQFEKVCKGLETFRDLLAKKKCMWSDEAAEAISSAECLIRQQQERIAELEAWKTVRVMTLEEVHEMAWDYCYLEEEVINDNVFQKYSGKHRIRCITWTSIASCVLTFGDGAYGKRWRCWTQRPSDTERSNTPWN